MRRAWGRGARFTPHVVRLLFGLLLLVGAFAVALAWQRRFVDAAAAPSIAVSNGAPRAASTDWVRIVVGAPSGVDPIEIETPRRETNPFPERPDPAAPAPAPVVASREFELTVQRGQTLSTICKAHYGTARVSVVEALARHNRMRDASSLREGQRLQLPALETLLKR